MNGVRIVIVRAEESDEAGLACLAARLQTESLPSLLSYASDADGPPASAVLPLEETERRELAHALRASANNVTRAAALGVNRATMYRKLKRYDLR